MAALPSSPTLTNPDMILPYASPSSATSSTSKDFRQFSTHPRNGGNTTPEDDEEKMRRGIRRLFGNGGKFQRDDSDTAILIKDDRKGTLIHTDSKLSSQHGHNGKTVVLASSPTFYHTPSHKSSSSVKDDKTDDDYWEGFDGPAVESVPASDLSRHQESFNGDPEPSDRASTPDHSQQSVAIQDEDENDPTSHAAMSNRAEQILANAKKRLLVRA